MPGMESSQRRIASTSTICAKVPRGSILPADGVRTTSSALSRICPEGGRGARRRLRIRVRHRRSCLFFTHNLGRLLVGTRFCRHFTCRASTVDHDVYAAIGLEGVNEGRGELFVSTSFRWRKEGNDVAWRVDNHVGRNGLGAGPGHSTSGQGRAAPVVYTLTGRGRHDGASKRQHNHGLGSHRSY